MARSFISCLSVLCVLFSGCATAEPKPQPQTNLATLITSTEKAPSNLGEVKVSLQFEHIDGEPFGNILWGGSGKYRVEPGLRNCGVYIYRGRTRWGGPLYGQAVIRANLLAGRTYRITGHYDEGMGTYAIIDAESGQLASEYVEVMFNVVHRPVPILIPIPIK